MNASQLHIAGSKTTFFVGLDLGQKHDHTAIAVLDRTFETFREIHPVSLEYLTATRYALRHLERIPLGTSYTAVVDRVGSLVTELNRKAQCCLVVDATGVGVPVVDLLHKSRLPCSLTAVTITGGDQASESNGQTRVPKRDLVAGLQLALEQKELRIADRLPEGQTLVRELMDMEVRVTGYGNEQYGAWREGSHDDLVLAVALAYWKGKRQKSIWATKRLI